IVEALGITNSRSLNSPQKILLKGFYNHDFLEEFILPKFEEGNVIFATEFPVLINMIAKVRNSPTIKDNDAIMVVAFTDHINQDSFTIEIDCHYLALAPHLIRITPTIKKNSQKLLLNPVNIPWKNKTSSETIKSQSIAKKIAAKINANSKIENSSSTDKALYVTKPSSATSKASTKNKDLSFMNNTI
ncbi:25742_t:CDS:2, partial [Dentiscutata erythropus]